MADAEKCAALLMETMPRMMRGLGAAMRHARPDDDALTLGQLRMLGVLCHSPRNLGELAALHNVTPSSMSRTVDVLVRKEWVARTPDPADRRQVILEPTEAGRAVHDAMQLHTQQTFTAMLAQMLGQLNDAERSQLYDGLLILQKLLANTSTDCVPHTQPSVTE